MQPLHEHLSKDGFRLRGTAMSRIDGFSDVVFGFALTLLVVSLEVPKTFDELNHSLRGFVPFAICFLMLILVWYSHYKFFRRYDLHDSGTIAINSLLLFVVLFYVYPLKFLFTVLSSQLFGADNSAFGTPGQMSELMTLYGIGFACVYLLFTGLYLNAWRQRRELQLNPIELFLTKSSLIEYTAMASVGLISVGVATLAPHGDSAIAGFIYILLWPFGHLHGWWERRRLKRLKPMHR